MGSQGTGDGTIVTGDKLSGFQVLQHPSKAAPLTAALAVSFQHLGGWVAGPQAPGHGNAVAGQLG